MTPAARITAQAKALADATRFDIFERLGAVLQQVCDAEGGGYVLQDLLLGPADTACRIVLAPSP